MFCRGDFSLNSSSMWASTSSLGIPDRGLVPMEGLVDSQASQPFSFVVIYTQTCYASIACMTLYVGS